MNTLLLTVFILGYIGIATESLIKINKAAIALITGVSCWTIYILSMAGPETVVHQLIEHLGDISQIIFFLMGAMTIVELIDSHHGFEVINKHINTKSKRGLLVIIALISFFLSSVLDNLTTTIVMVTLIQKLIQDKSDRLYFAGIIVIAANAGGAWTPIGDVTTTMLWIGGQISTFKIMKGIFLPSLVSMMVPLILISFMVKGRFAKNTVNHAESFIPPFEMKLVLILGITALIFVPVFKTFTHLPPFMGMLIGLSVLWIVTEILHRKKEDKRKITVSAALKKIDIPSVLFFLGILIAVSALESTGMLTGLASSMNKMTGDLRVISLALGILSSVIDNVPLVAAAMGMYDLQAYPMDHYFWELIAYCAGTGGSILIVGSAAGVAAMGLEKIDFFWYLKKVSLIALAGYFSGAFIYILFH